MKSVTHSLTDPALPPEVRDASAWYGPDLASRGDWIEHMTDTEIAEVESAILEAQRSNRDLACNHCGRKFHFQPSDPHLLTFTR
jgi:hypothetical protein